LFPDNFTLGGYKLQVLDHQIVENGKVIFEDSDYGIEISIEDGFHAKDVDAVALVVSDGGTLGCISDFVLEARHNAPLQVFNLGENDCAYSAQLTPDGFRFTGAVDEVDGRMDFLWHVKDGLFEPEKVDFEPDPGSKLTDMDQTFRSHHSPLANEEFDAILKTLGDQLMRPDVKAAKEVLQYAMPVKSIAGPDYIVLAGCDTSVRDACANGGGRYRTTERSMASSQSPYLPEAYYALDVHLTGMNIYPESNCGDRHSVQMSPMRQEWPPELLKQLDDWIMDQVCG
jgi:hypothetical protein